MEKSPPAALARRKTPVQARSRVTVDAIYQAAIQVLLADGFARLNTTRVARRAGVSVGTLYQYFPHKHALLFAVLERHLDMLVTAVEGACRDHHGTPVEVMAEAVAKAYLRAKAQQSEISSALYLIAVEMDAQEPVEAATRRGEQAIMAMLSTASDGAFDRPDVISQILLAAISGAVRVFYERAMPPTPDSEVERQLILMCRAYLAAARGPGRTPA